MVQTDGWAAYKKIDWQALNLIRNTNVHSGGNRTFKNGHLIEGLWAQLKFQAKSIYNSIPGSHCMEDYLWESAYRIKINRIPV